MQGCDLITLLVLWFWVCSSLGFCGLFYRRTVILLWFWDLLVCSEVVVVHYGLFGLGVALCVVEDTLSISRL
ncbi:hypothetical protein EDD86DRAFT_211976 [Gorgonomyces haynaldii]|nr:hypothetical protein EDD86DRAFT_215745 [Gorgonomyces haynaldii]KAI8903708.1 hypothetical protein EDD86DRAFT_214037 [Gorgonomyces haynaldii]KAI8905642.1 hypothetical protein EDD86DRAFT_211976 [Gorgonomyces haynaldii]